MTAKVEPHAMICASICVPERQKTALLTRFPKLLSAAIDVSLFTNIPAKKAL